MKNSDKTKNCQQSDAGCLLPRQYLGTSVLLLAAVLMSSGYLGYLLGYADIDPPQEIVALQADIQSYKHDIERLRERSQADLNAMAMRLGMLQSEMVRIEALGQRLTLMAKLDKGEFDFSKIPAQGGPVNVADVADYSMPDLDKEIGQLGRCWKIVVDNWKCWNVWS